MSKPSQSLLQQWLVDVIDAQDDVEKDIAGRIGMHPKLLSQYKTGAKPISRKAVVRVVKALNVKPPDGMNIPDPTSTTTNSPSTSPFGETLSPEQIVLQYVARYEELREAQERLKKQIAELQEEIGGLKEDVAEVVKQLGED